MPPLKDLTGMRFGRLVVNSYAGKDKHRESLWLCTCDCGKVVTVISCNLRTGNTTSCGCYGRQRKSEANITHGLTGTRLHRIWRAMNTRCYNENFFAYKYYGGRGITICDEWRKDFKAFHDWAMGHGYSDALTIDRIDNNKGYFPDNCRWVTMAEQNKNKRVPNGYKIKE
jgi:hypothetical protein